MDRRNIIRLGLIGIASVICSGNAHAMQRFMRQGVYSAETRIICIHNLHTKETTQTVYWKNGRYIDSALKELDYIFRDHYNGAVKRIDKRLLDFLYAIQQKVRTGEPFHLISGYRSRKTNERLRKNNKAVAKRSMHIFGKAADIRLPAVDLRKLRRAAYELQAGGVGYYPKSEFVHIDVGNVRFWRG
jgi:uncharacterized protein YcbK (DUF882 family)